MGRIKREFVRPQGEKDSRLFIIATEGAYTEKIYFEKLSSKEYYYNSKVHVKILPPTENKSAPNHVLNSLKGFRDEFFLEEDDELWLVIDRDRSNIKPQMLMEISHQCSQCNIFIGLSNPNFELWLLLHLIDVSQLTEDIKDELYENRKVSKARTRIEKEIIKYNGSYNKSGYNPSDYICNVNDAIIRAKKLDKSPEHNWPEYLATRVYQLVEKIINIK